MSLLLLYTLTAVIFVILDALVLPRLVLPLFRESLGETLADPFRYGPAAVFYLFFLGALVFLITGPALSQGTGLMRAALEAGVFGAAAYGTYEFTNLATIRGWTWRMLTIDLTWGVSLTTIAATGGLAITRVVTG